ncbi:unnamed protein product [Prorocentrum cordatum]|uniref:Uncharacterized protein n=1 Tax=Prorocentrum cordatum TaxID=2364126 RepID=A0ABN9TGT4_9DINO|nr:unnamed protein product [Polarella glacialis]
MPGGLRPAAALAAAAPVAAAAAGADRGQMASPRARIACRSSPSPEARARNLTPSSLAARRFARCALNSRGGGARTLLRWNGVGLVHIFKGIAPPLPTAQRPIVVRSGGRVLSTSRDAACAPPGAARSPRTSPRRLERALRESRLPLAALVRDPLARALSAYHEVMKRGCASRAPEAPGKHWGRLVADLGRRLRAAIHGADGHFWPQADFLTRADGRRLPVQYVGKLGAGGLAGELEETCPACSAGATASTPAPRTSASTRPSCRPSFTADLRDLPRRLLLLRLRHPRALQEARLLPQASAGDRAMRSCFPTSRRGGRPIIMKRDEHGRVRGRSLVSMWRVCQATSAQLKSGVLDAVRWNLWHILWHWRIRVCVRVCIGPLLVTCGIVAQFLWKQRPPSQFRVLRLHAGVERFAEDPWAQRECRWSPIACSATARRFRLSTGAHQGAKWWPWRAPRELGAARRPPSALGTGGPEAATRCGWKRVGLCFVTELLGLGAV